MICKRLFRLRIILVIMVILPFIINAQGKGRVGLIVKAIHILPGGPQGGFSYSISDRIQARFLVYTDSDVEDLGLYTTLDISFLIRLFVDGNLTSYFGPNFFYNGFIDRVLLGIIFGNELQVYKKLCLFDEFGASLRIGDGIEGISFPNFGIGIKYYFK